MSWALEAIEKAAMERARRELIANPGDITVFGLRTAQIAALDHFFHAHIGSSAMAFEPAEISRRLESLVRK